MTMAPEAAAAGIHRRSIVIDMCSFYLRGFSPELAASGATAVNVTVPETSAGFEQAVTDIERHHRLIEADPEHLTLVRRGADIRAAKASGRVGIIFGFQNSAPVGEDATRVRTLHRLGVRVLQLTYMYRNLYGDGCLEPTDAGLSRLGRRVIAEMNDAGVVCDLAHVGYRTVREAAEASRDPVIVSHANPRALADNPRNLPDDVIKAVVASGGVVGACGWSPICWRGGDRPPDAEDLAAHLEYLVDLVGVENVGLGLDSPAAGLGTVAAHAAEMNSLYPEVTGAFVERFGEALEIRYGAPVWSLPRITDALAARGWAEADIARVMGGNFLRVLERVWR